jgi:hypothetical protein
MWAAQQTPILYFSIIFIVTILNRWRILNIKLHQGQIVLLGSESKIDPAAVIKN